MTRYLRSNRPALLALVLVLAGPAFPAFAQNNSAEARLRQLEAEVRALQRQVFPGGDARYFTPEMQAQANARPGTAATSAPPATTPVTDLLTRMEALEVQIARLTAQGEENANRLNQIEARLANAAPAGAAQVASVQPAPAQPAQAAPATAGLSAMIGQSAPVQSAPAATTAPATRQPAAVAAPATTTVRPPATAAAPVAVAPVTRAPAPTTAAPAQRPPATVAAPATRAPATAAAPARAAPATPAAQPSAQRLAAVRAIIKPQTTDAGDDEYSYGFRLWEARFYPEAQQQLKLFLERYPRHARVSFARNLLGRTYLDEGNPREAATWFLQNYNADKSGARAADSLLFLAEAMNRLGDTSRACIALAEFGDTYAGEAAGRLKTQYDTTRSAVTCN